MLQLGSARQISTHNIRSIFCPEETRVQRRRAQFRSCPHPDDMGHLTQLVQNPLNSKILKLIYESFSNSDKISLNS